MKHFLRPLCFIFLIIGVEVFHSFLDKFMFSEGRTAGAVEVMNLAETEHKITDKDWLFKMKVKYEDEYKSAVVGGQVYALGWVIFVLLAVLGIFVFEIISWKSGRIKTAGI